MPHVARNELASRILDSIQEGLAVIDVRGEVLYWNTALEGLLGWTAAEQEGHPWLDRFPPSVRPRMSELATTVREASHWEGELREWHKCGSSLMVRGQLQSRDGLLFWELSPSTPIDELMARVLDAIAGPVAVLDKNGTIVFVNAAWRRFEEASRPPSGEPARVEPGVNYLEVCLHSGDEGGARAAAGIAAILHGTRASFEMEYPCHHPDGTERWFLLSTSSLAGRGAIVSHLDITNRHQLEAALRERNEQLELALAAANMGVWLTDRNLTTVDWSPSLYSVLGVREFDGQADTFERLIHPEDRESARRSFNQALLEGSTFQYDFRMVRPDRQVRWVTNVVRARIDEDGQFSGVLGTVQDITARKSVELMLAGQNQILEMIAGRLPLTAVLERIVALLEKQVPGVMASLMLAEPGGSFLTLGASGSLPRGYCAQLGQVPIGPCAGSCGTAAYYREMVAVSNVATHPLWADYRDLALKYDLHACFSWPVWSSGAQGGRLLGTFAVYLSGPDPAPALLEAIAAPVHTCVHLAILAIDNEAVQAALSRSEERFRNVVDASPALVYLQDLEGRLIFLNRRTAALLNRQDGDWEGRAPTEVVPAPLLELFERPLREVLQDFRQVQLEETTGPDDAPSFWLVSAFPLRDKEGCPYVVCVTATDVTAQKESLRAHQHLEELYRQAQRMEAIGKLAGGVAHDFNNLLTVINGYAECTLLELGPDHPCADSLSNIRKAGERAAGLTSQLLTFSRKAVVAPRPTCLNRVVERSVTMLQRLIGEDIELKTVLDPTLKNVLIDAGQAEQVFMNLAVNARDAMPAGGQLTFTSRNSVLSEPRTVSTGLLAPGEYVQIRVIDTGDGMVPELLEHIFEPFFTTKSIGEGTGLGLATVYGVVSQAGGGIEVSSAPSAGTTFGLWLPALAGSPAPSAPPEETSLPPRGHETILLVEDEASLRRLARLTLERQGYKVIEADNGKSSADLIASLDEPVQLVLTDVVMPHGGGAHVAQLARARWPGVKVLFTSGYLDDAVLRQGVELAQETFLPKPFTVHTLAHKVRVVLDA